MLNTWGGQYWTAILQPAWVFSKDIAVEFDIEFLLLTFLALFESFIVDLIKLDIPLGN